MSRTSAACGRVPAWPRRLSFGRLSRTHAVVQLPVIELRVPVRENDRSVGSPDLLRISGQ